MAARGLDVVGVDLDPAMIDPARVKAPELEWIEADLATVDIGRQFDVVVMAGNVMIFVEPSTEAAVVANMARHVAPGGHLIAGFQLGRSFGLDAYDAAAAAAGLEASTASARGGRSVDAGRRLRRQRPPRICRAVIRPPAGARRLADE